MPILRKKGGQKRVKKSNLENVFFLKKIERAAYTSCKKWWKIVFFQKTQKSSRVTRSVPKTLFFSLVCHFRGKKAIFSIFCKNPKITILHKSKLPLERQREIFKIVARHTFWPSFDTIFDPKLLILFWPFFDHFLGGPEDFLKKIASRAAEWLSGPPKYP